MGVHPQPWCDSRDGKGDYFVRALDAPGDSRGFLKSGAGAVPLAHEPGVDDQPLVALGTGSEVLAEPLEAGQDCGTRGAVVVEGPFLGVEDGVERVADAPGGGVQGRRVRALGFAHHRLCRASISRGCFYDGRKVEGAAGALFKLGEGFVHDIGRGARVEGEAIGGAKLQERGGVEPGVLGEEFGVHLVEGVGRVVPVLGKAAIGMVFLKVGGIGRQDGQERERGDAHPPEGLVGHLAGIAGGCLLAADAADGVLDPGGDVGCAEGLVEGALPAAGLVDVEVGGAVGS